MLKADVQIAYGKAEYVYFVSFVSPHTRLTGRLNFIVERWFASSFKTV